MMRMSIFSRDMRNPGAAGYPARKWLNPAYLVSAAAAAIIGLTLMSLDPHTAQATRHTVLAIPGQTSTGLTAGGNPSGVQHPDDADSHTVPLDLPAQAVNAPAPPPQEQWREVTVRSGDSLAAIFDRMGITPQDLHNLLAEGGATRNLRKIFPGETLRVITDQDKHLVKLNYPIDRLNTLQVVRGSEGFDVSTVTRTPEFRTRVASGKIDSSLFLAGSKAGLPDSMIMELANIFGWDIDFALDIRAGDQFTVLYKEMYLDGESIGNGTIIAAEFINQGKRYQAIRYTDAGGNTDYYSPDGKSMRKKFLRTPVEFTRISSGFSLGRWHPILNKIRAHKGVDYAAPTGTPIKATGDGKITFRGRKGGYGNVIIIQHGAKYSTLYGHMSKFRGGLAVGSRIRQGQVIGYVGMTGLATGPHLHYEFRINGVHRDPLRVKLPGADPLAAKYRDDFNRKAHALLAKLDLVREVQVARTE
jgi:murein DD-endopeptidase MepM/ murein hydrolase activator NlpD